MEQEKELDLKIADALKRRAAAKKRIHDHRNRLAELEAHKNTLISILTGCPPSKAFPIPMKHTSPGPLLITDESFPLVVLSLGILDESSVRNSPDGIAYPSGYKILRRFAAHLASRASRREIFYTSIILSRGDTRFYIIRDDENNIWKGVDIFESFRQSFSFLIPFRNIEDWFGLTDAKIRSRIACLETYTPKQPSTAKSNSTLDRYIRRAE